MECDIIRLPLIGIALKRQPCQYQSNQLFAHLLISAMSNKMNALPVLQYMIHVIAVMFKQAQLILRAHYHFDTCNHHADYGYSAQSRTLWNRLNPCKAFVFFLLLRRTISYISAKKWNSTILWIVISYINDLRVQTLLHNFSDTPKYSLDPDLPSPSLKSSALYDSQTTMLITGSNKWCNFCLRSI